MGGERKRVSARLRFPSAENASYCRVPLERRSGDYPPFFRVPCRNFYKNAFAFRRVIPTFGPPSAAEPGPERTGIPASIAFRSRDRTSITTELFPCPSTNTIALIAAKILKNG